MLKRLVLASPAVLLCVASLASAQAPAVGAGTRPAPIPVPQSSDFSVLVPTRGGWVNVPLSPSGWPFAPDQSGVAAPPAPPPPPGVAAPPAPPAPPPVSADSTSGDGYQVIDPRATSPQPPATGSGFFVVPRP